MAAIATKINAIVTAALADAQQTTLDNFQTFLATKEDVDMDFMKELIDEFRSKMPMANPVSDSKVTETKPKKAKAAAKAPKAKKDVTDSNSDDTAATAPAAAKKKPSAYNLFIKFAMTDESMKDRIKEKMNTEDAEQPKGRMLMKAAMELWADISEASKDKMKVLYKENPELTGKELYEQSKDA
jgi:hypothetical protein